MSMQENLAALKVALRCVPASVVVTDAGRPDHPIVHVNAAFEALTGYSAAEVLGRNCRFLQGPETEPEAVAQMREALRDGRACTVSLRNYRKDGAPLSLQVAIEPIVDNGRVTHFIGVHTDLALESARSEFLATLSHDLRNPLNALTSAIYLLKQKTARDADLARPIEIAERQVRQLAKMVDDLLD
jgi:PAS domain S-box-containing protein